ncbi:MAG: hypothetical protein WC758_05625 [Candidatus Woesearchaeota archaeon]
MLLVRILGFLDFLSGLMILLFQYDVIGTRLLMSFIAYLLIKGIVFRGDFASFIDTVIAIYMIFMIFLPITVLSYIAAIYLFQKSVTSLMM